MSIIATLFLEGWKRYHAELAWKWGLLDFEIDEVFCYDFSLFFEINFSSISIKFLLLHLFFFHSV